MNALIEARKKLRAAASPTPLQPHRYAEAAEVITTALGAAGVFEE